MKVGSRDNPSGWSLIPLVLPLCVYISTLSPTVGLIDSGELTVVCKTLGVAHPTGYPLYTILGRLFSLIPVKDIAWRINLASAVFGSLAVFTLFWILHARTRSVITSMAGSLFFGFSYTHWSVSSVAEVHSLTALLLGFLLLTLSRCEKSETPIPLFFFLLGLSLTNHLAISCAGICGVIYILILSRKTPSRILFWASLFLLGFSLYLYLIIRAKTGPTMNWGDPRNLERLLWHMSGKQYRVWMLSQPLGVVLKKIQSYGWLLLKQYPPYIVWLLIPGFVHIFRNNLKFGALLTGIIILNVGYAVNYSIPDIDPYFIPSFYVIAILLGFGVLSVSTYTRRASHIFLILPLLLIWTNYNKVNLSNNYIAYDYAKNVLRSAEPEGIIITNLWDIYSPALYITDVEEFRGDVCLIDKELLRRSWYFKYLEEECPWLVINSKPEIDRFLVLLEDFEHGRLQDPAEIQKRFITMINSFIYKNLDEKAIYITFLNSSDRDERFIAPDLHRLPVGLLYRLDDEERYHAFSWDKLVLRGVRDLSIHKDERTEFIISNYPKMMMRRSLYLKKLGQAEESESLSKRALDFR